MKIFLDDNFLLSNKTAQQLYHGYAKDMPIIDYHCHLSPEQIAKDHQFQNLTQVWLYGDHYKWRAMRTNGIDESYCTGAKATKKNLNNGQPRCLTHCETRSITGRTWNCGDILV